MAAIPERVEVAIVGGGPAGMATALSLARVAPDRIGQVVVLERSTFPRDKVCAGGIGARADRVLELLEVDLDVPAVPVHGLCLRLPAGTRTVRAQRPIGRVVRRMLFDHALAQAARAKGICVIEGANVHSLEPEGAFTRVRTSLGESRARVVVGADGVGSVVRRALGLAQGSFRAQAVEVDTDRSDRDEPRDILLFESMDRTLTGYTWDFPTVVDGREMVCRGAYVLRHGNGSPDAGAALDAHLASRGLDPKAFLHKRYAERGYVRALAYSRPGWLLVGEAAGIDPVAGEGIPQALLYGELAGRYLAACFERRDLRFADWSDQVARALFGKDLRLRARLVDMFYGPDRPWLERILVEQPWFLQAGIEYFAGRRVPRAWLARLAWFASTTYLRACLSKKG